MSTTRAAGAYAFGWWGEQQCVSNGGSYYIAGEWFIRGYSGTLIKQSLMPVG
jgi:hypothetical protein